MANLKTEVTRKQRTPIFRKIDFFLSLIRTRRCAYQVVRNVRFPKNLAYFVFSLPPFSDSPFCPITNEMWYYLSYKTIKKFLSPDVFVYVQNASFSARVITLGYICDWISFLIKLHLLYHGHFLKSFFVVSGEQDLRTFTKQLHLPGHRA